MTLINRETDALIIVDIQNDFCPAGALAVPDGDHVVDAANRLMKLFDIIVLTQDWHPADHFSFASQHDGKQPFETVDASYGTQVLWPDHCIAGTHGSAFHQRLDSTSAQLIIRKGFRRRIDSYSAFFENDRKTATGLAGYLESRGTGRVFLCGLATDYCVGFSALDARVLGYRATIIEDACRAIDLDGSLDAMKHQFAGHDIDLISSDML